MTQLHHPQVLLRNLTSANHKEKRTPIYCSTVHNSSVRESACMYINREVVCGKMWDPYNHEEWEAAEVASSESTRTCPGTSSTAGHRLESSNPTLGHVDLLT